ncbi:MAG: methionyl-tRNA formyltransferase [Legionella sp.]
MRKLSIVFAGTPAFGLPCLEALTNAHHLKAVYTQPDRPAGRGRQMQASAVKLWAQERNIPIYQPTSFKDPKAVADLKQLAPDLIVVIAYGLLLPQSVLDIPPLGCINVHASLLPRWRGASPIQHAILYGDHQTGITIMQMDVGMDTGAILKQNICTIETNDQASSLHDRLAAMSPEPLLATIASLVNGSAQPETQNNKLATYAPKLLKTDARINWHEPAIYLDQKIRAFNPWPVAYTYAKEEIIRIYQARVIQSTEQQTPGTIMSIDKDGILVATGNHLLLIEKIQFAGAKVIAVSDWLNTNQKQLATEMILT